MLFNPIKNSEDFGENHLQLPSGDKLAKVPSSPNQWNIEFEKRRDWELPAPSTIEPIFNVIEGQRGCDAMAWSGRSGKPLPCVAQRENEVVVAAKRTIVGCLMLDMPQKPFGIFEFHAKPAARENQNLIHLKREMLFSGLGAYGFLPKRLRKYNGIARQCMRLLNNEWVNYRFTA